MEQRRIPRAAFSDYYAAVHRRSRAGFRGHLRSQVAVSLVIAIITGLFAWMLGAELASLGYALGAFGLWFPAAAFFFRERAQVELHLEITEEREDARAEVARLNADIGERECVRFEIETLAPEYLGDRFERGRTFHERALLWLVVRNTNGPTARFFAEYSNVRDVVRLETGEVLEPRETWQFVGLGALPVAHGRDRLPRHRADPRRGVFPTTVLILVSPAGKYGVGQRGQPFDQSTGCPNRCHGRFRPTRGQSDREQGSPSAGGDLV